MTEPTQHGRDRHARHPTPYDPGEGPAPVDPGDGTVVLALAAGDRRWAAHAVVGICSAWARAGRRIVLADMNFDDPVLDGLLGLDGMQGIVDLFLYGASVSRTAESVPGEDFYVIPVGTYEPDPQIIYRNARWPKLIAGFRDANATLVLFAPARAAGMTAIFPWIDQCIILGTADAGLLDDLAVYGIAPTANLVQPSEQARPEPEPELSASEPSAREPLASEPYAPELPGPEPSTSQPSTSEPSTSESEPSARLDAAGADEYIDPGALPIADLGVTPETGSEDVLPYEPAGPETPLDRVGRTRPAEPEIDLVPPPESLDGSSDVEPWAVAPVTPDRDEPEPVVPIDSSLPGDYDWHEEPALDDDLTFDESAVNGFGATVSYVEPEAPQTRGYWDDESPPPGDDAVRENGEIAGLGELRESTARADLGEAEISAAEVAGESRALEDNALRADEIPGEPAAALPAKQKKESGRGTGRRHGGGIGPYLPTILVVALAAFVFAVLGYIIARERPELVPWGTRSAPANQSTGSNLRDGPLAVATDASRTGSALPYSVTGWAFVNLDAAADHAARERERFGAAPVFVSPEEIQGVLYYKVLAGAVADTSAASRLRAQLVDAGLVEPTESIIQFSPLAFDLGEFVSRDSATARVDSLAGIDVPAYIIAIPYSDGTRRWQLYGGAYRDSVSADAMRRQLQESGISSRLVARIGEAAADR